LIDTVCATTDLGLLLSVRAPELELEIRRSVVLCGLLSTSSVRPMVPVFATLLAYDASMGRVLLLLCLFVVLNEACGGNGAASSVPVPSSPTAASATPVAAAPSSSSSPSDVPDVDASTPSAPAPSSSSSATPAPTSSADTDSTTSAWAARCVVEMTKGRDEAAKLRPALKKETVRTNRPPDGGTVVFFGDDDFGAQAVRGVSHSAAHPTWVDVVSAEGHRKGHWFWQRTYASGHGSVTFDGRPDAPVEKVRAAIIETMKKAIDRCFADASSTDSKASRS
jgi:hypothetical protein